MYISITGSSSNKNVYITQSYCKPDGKTSSRIYKKLGKYNDLLADFSGDHEKMMAWAKEEAAKETALFTKQEPLTLDIFFYSIYATNYGLMPYAETSETAAGSRMTFLPF